MFPLIVHSVMSGEFTSARVADFSLGWTGDIQVFAPTANFLFDTSGFLGNWLHDLYEEQLKDYDGIVPLVVPDVLNMNGPPPLSQAVWVSRASSSTDNRATFVYSPPKRCTRHTGIPTSSRTRGSPCLPGLTRARHAARMGYGTIHVMASS